MNLKCMSYYRGVSSTVRRCVEKETGHEYAAKIIDVSADLEDSQGMTLRQATIREISILRLVAGHPYISMNYLNYSQCNSNLLFLVELHDVFESSTYIFLVFELYVLLNIWNLANSSPLLDAKMENFLTT